LERGERATEAAGRNSNPEFSRTKIDEELRETAEIGPSHVPKDASPKHKQLGARKCGTGFFREVFTLFTTGHKKNKIHARYMHDTRIHTRYMGYVS
jgi:hypothetical protein